MKLGMIGFGNMAQAILRGLFVKQNIDPKEVYVCAAHYKKLCQRAETFNVNPCHDAQEVIEKSDMIILAIKPYQIEDVCGNLSFQNKIVVSVVAGKPYEVLSKICTNCALLCTIPNTPIAVGEGILLVEEQTNCTPQQYEQFRQVFEPIALIEKIDADHMDIAMILSSCAPAFTAMYLEALGDAGVKYGLKREEAYALASKMIEGVGALYLSEKQHPGVMKDAVCSPKGSTIKGVCALEKGAFRHTVISAVDAIEK